MTTFKHVSTTVERTFEVSDAPDMAKRYSDTVTIRPDKAVAEFGDGAFVRIVFSGPNVKKDGTVGVNRHEESFWRSRRKEIPDWAQPLTDPNFDGSH